MAVKIPNIIESVAADKKVALSSSIYDNTEGKFQSEVNADLKRAIQNAQGGGSYNVNLTAGTGINISSNVVEVLIGSGLEKGPDNELCVSIGTGLAMYDRVIGIKIKDGLKKDNENYLVPKLGNGLMFDSLGNIALNDSSLETTIQNTVTNKVSSAISNSLSNAASNTISYQSNKLNVKIADNSLKNEGGIAVNIGSEPGTGYKGIEINTSKGGLVLKYSSAALTVNSSGLDIDIPKLRELLGLPQA